MTAVVQDGFINCPNCKHHFEAKQHGSEGAHYAKDDEFWLKKDDVHRVRYRAIFSFAKLLQPATSEEISHCMMSHNFGKPNPGRISEMVGKGILVKCESTDERHKETRGPFYRVDESKWELIKPI